MRIMVPARHRSGHGLGMSGWCIFANQVLPCSQPPSEPHLKRHSLRTSIAPLAAASAMLIAQSAAALPNTSDTRMLSEPAVSARHIAFMYAGDLWLANLDGSAPRRLTSDVGEKSNPVFSPDGKLLAYTAQLDGNADVYV
eukprot:gene38922-48062_t